MLDDRKPNIHVQQTEIPHKLREMVDLLVDEEARQEDNTTGLCLEYFLKNGVLQYLVTVSEKEDYPVGIRGEAIRTVASMIDLLDDRFLVHNAVHKPTIKLLRFCVLDDHPSELYSDDLVDLMYIICSKIHGFPALLNIFFHDKVWLTTPQKNHSAEEQPETLDEEHMKDPPHEYEFLLFTYLLRFVHREGRSGDFARTGLLFLMEMAVDQLGDFILGSDFATIMAAGLGALYSQLPRKLIIQNETENIYANSTSYLLGQDALMDDHDRIPVSLGMEYSNSPDFKYQLDSFLKLLEFCQDVLTRCPNPDICVALLSSIRSAFLENILYPSILECSDTDGSSVAVISYIDLILQTIQQGDLAKVVVGYLMDDEEVELDEDSSIATSVDQLNLNDTPTRKPSISPHITLKDLIFYRLKSTSQPTVIATLKLLKTLITKHCPYSLKLFSSIYPDNKEPIMISHHLREIDLYFSLLVAIDAENANQVLSCGYEDYLRDIEMTIDNDSCYQPKQEHTIEHNKESLNKLKRRRSFKYGQRFEAKEDRKKPNSTTRRSLFRHKLRSSDPILQILLSLLSHFFTQSAELNLALTGAISALALCPYRSLEGWISFSESDRTTKDDILVLGDTATKSKPKVRRQDIYATFDDTAPVDDDDDDDDRSVDFGAERGSNAKTTPAYFKSYPQFFTLLRTLTQQVDYYRSDIQAFDKLLEERRSALISGETQSTMVANRRPSTVFLQTPLLSPSSSASTAMSRTALQPTPLILPQVLSNPVAPFTLHVKKTMNTRIQPLFPSHFKEQPILDLDDEDEHTFTAEPSKAKRGDKITLSMLLNNVVILEETIKELVALIQVRRSLGIDQIVYV